jgi:hypothetical protein
MSLEQLRKLACVRQDDDGSPDQENDYTLGFNFIEQRTAYVPSVFYDQERFSSEADLERLRRALGLKFPKQKDWVFEPARAASLDGRMKLVSVSHTNHFLQYGYVAEIMLPAFKSGPAPARSIRSQQAWDAFLVNTVIAEAIVNACGELPEFRQRMIFKNPERGVLAPIVGKRFENDEPRGTTVLYHQKGMLFAPRGILTKPLAKGEQRTAYPADPVTTNTASTSGRAALELWTSDSRLRIRQRVKKEILAWSRLAEGPDVIDAHLMCIAQTLGVLRVQATEWKSRERRSYVLSEASTLASAQTNLRMKEDDVQEEFRKIMSDLKDGLNSFVAPTINRPPISARGDVISRLAGGIGLEDEAIWRDDQLHRDSLARYELGYLAQWVGELKRFHRATLNESLARLIDEIVSGVPDTLHELELTDDDWSGPWLIRAQFPVAIWEAMLDAIKGPNSAGKVEVRYLWNKNPVEPMRILQKDDDEYRDDELATLEDDTVVIAGPLLDLSAQRRAWWKDQAELFRPTHSLTK